MDRLSLTDRSRLMGNVRGKDTTPEIRVRKLAHALGYRFRLHRRDLPGSPDLVFAGRRKAIFVHGCFWHRHPGCRKSSTPTTRVEFWHAKFKRNVERDARNERELRTAGWDVLTIWECETRNADRLTQTLRDFLGAPGGGVARRSVGVAGEERLHAFDTRLARRYFGTVEGEANNGRIVD